jgi:proteasome lid subunit RPN8/RPN11
MSWKELPPDFQLAPFEVLLRALPLTDVLSICYYTGKADTLVLLHRSAEDRAKAFAKSQRVESGGLLLGRVFVNGGEVKSSLKYIVVVAECVSADDSHGTATALRMEPALWSKANKLKRSNQFVVGWFHSHPNLGAFFSGTDRRTQAAFFSESYKLGWVIDPIRTEEAWFAGPDSKDLSQTMIIRGEFSSLNTLLGI